MLRSDGTRYEAFDVTDNNCLTQKTRFHIE